MKLFGKYTIAMLILFVAGLTACHEEKKSNAYTTDSEQTLLIYMVGDDATMSPYVRPNMNLILAGMQQCATPPNVVIYHDNRAYKEELPVLFQLKLREDHSKIDTVYIKQWKQDLDSSDPGHIASVVSSVFSKFNTPIKGIDFWGHGLSWLPGNKFQLPDSTGTRAGASFGVDEGEKADIWELSSELEETGIHFNYIIFDACNMGTAEVAYEFRHLTDYILASPTEIMGAGFPYDQTIQALSVIKDEETVVDGLTQAFEGYRDHYDGSVSELCGTMSLIFTAGMEDLLKACRELESHASEGLALWDSIPRTYEQKIQHYGRSKIKSYYYFYDLLDWADKLSETSGGLDYSDVKSALEGCILQHCNTSYFMEIPLRRCYGLGMSIPQFWNLSGNEKLDPAYQLLQWQL